MYKDGRPSLMEFRDQHHFDVVEIARRAGTHEITVMTMLRGQPVWRAQAEKVLCVLSDCVGTILTLENIYVPIFDEDKEEKGKA